MLKFEPITLEDKSIFDKYLGSYNFSTSEYSFTNLIIWRKACDIRYTVYQDALIIKKADFNGNYHFMQPIGYTRQNLKAIVEELVKYKREHNMAYLFEDAENTFLEDLKEIYGSSMDIKEDIDNFDYIYTSEKLISLSGKKLHAKKNHYNYFIKNYAYEAKDFFEPGVKSDIKTAAENWYREKNGGNKYLEYELMGIDEITENMKFLNLKAMAVYVESKIVAFTIGERMNDNTGIIHIEKASSSTRGSYAFVNKTFVENYLSDVKYINREQDLGIPGLRKAKKSYHPVKMGEKYCVDIPDIAVPD
ncbi:MAG TPA: hypothetical protein DC034_06845 [Clostridium sp.]|jgi:hypothetical protein|uniref:DUF2156 domain-containing protein n=1 Tax=uncultured Clostridium sp. TaxID=59620 RepID=UPI000E82D241|nr:DUF2156 domain-containing protein [uncultured Clostridium sp.]NLU07802.1 DUF2156 domain-containing protein [Clostridiales bacterium]HBC96496.1 hypothetical protein [Clostridium sp.]